MTRQALRSSGTAARFGNQCFEGSQTMSTVKAIDLRRGMAVRFKDGIWVCVENEKVAKGNWRSSQVIQIKNIKTGQLLKDRFRTDEDFEEAYLDHKDMEFLYAQSGKLVFMDPESYEQVELPADFIGDMSVYLTPNLHVQVSFVEGKPIIFQLPNVVELKIIETAPHLQGATATNQMKEAVCEGGAKVRVPPFVEAGTVIKIDTRTGEYLSRA
jgi:elongation factor P